MGFTVNPMLPLWAVGCVAVALLGVLGYGTRLLLQRGISARWVAALAVVRVLAVAIFVLCLLRPTLSYQRERPERPELFVLVDTSASMGLTDGEKTSRWERVQDALRSRALRMDLMERFSVQWFAFDAQARPIGENELGSLQPTGTTTRYAESLQSAISLARRPDGEAGARSARREILLVSDGNDTGVSDAVDTARRLGAVVHVLPPPTGSGEEVATRVTIAAVHSPRRVLIGSESRLITTVRREGAGPAAVRLELAEDGRPMAMADLNFGADEVERTETLAFQPVSEGPKRYRLTLHPKQGMEISVGPPAEITMVVESRRVEVLFLEDTWRWEFAFLRRIFENDPSFTFTAFLARDAGTYMQFGEAERQVNLGGYPQTRAELEWFDIVVLGDVRPERWPRGVAAALRDLVVEDGKSLVVIAGPNVARLGANTEIGLLLPVEVTSRSAQPVAGPVPVRMSLEAQNSPMFFSGDGPARRWAGLPPMDQVYPPLRKRPAATVVLEAADRANEFGPLIVVAEHTVGRGRVLYVGTDTLWKWQMRGAAEDSGVTPYTQFWHQALRALQPPKSFPSGVSLIAVPDRSRYLPGQRIRIRAELFGLVAAERATVRSEVTLPDGRKFPAVFQRSAQQGLAAVWDGEFESPLAGQVQLTCTAEESGRMVAEMQSLIDVEPLRPEQEQARVDLAALEHLARGTGGRVMRADRPETYPEPPPLEAVRVSETRSVDLWGKFWLLGALVAVLGADWLVRLVRGYV